MRRRRLGVAVASALATIAAVAPGAQAKRAALPSLFHAQIARINAAAKAPPVLLPPSMTLDATHFFASGGPSGRSYDLELGAARNCGGADACFVAAFTAEPGRTVFGTRVTVRGAKKAGFHPLSCGASCSPPQIDFIVGATRYTIQARFSHTKRGDRATLIAAAQAAIAAGPR